MKFFSNLTEKQASVLLSLVISARATSFMFSKLCLATMNPSSLLAVRFLLAALLMLLIFHRTILRSLTRANVLSGIAFGTCFFCVLQCEFHGLKTADSSTASFLENMAIIIVPFLEAALGRRLPFRKDLLRVALAFAGVALLTLKAGGLAFTQGELFLLMAALLYAVSIIVTNRLSRKGDAFVMGFFQVSTIGVLGLIFALPSGDFTMPVSAAQWGMILMLAVVCTGFGFTLQPVAQSRISSEKAGLFCALSPLIAGVLGAVFMHEVFSAAGLAGAALILCALLIR